MDMMSISVVSFLSECPSVGHVYGYSGKEKLPAYIPTDAKPASRVSSALAQFGTRRGFGDAMIRSYL
jgi:hypothetical protein